MKQTHRTVSRVHRATAEDKKDKRKGRIIAFFLHIVLLGLAIWPFLVELPEEKTAEVKVVMVDFRDPPPLKQTSGSSREGASAPAKTGVENKPTPDPKPAEVPTPPKPEPVPEPVPEPTPPKPQPKPELPKVTPKPKPEIVTTKRPEPVTIPPTPPAPTPPEPEPQPEPEPEPQPEPEPTPPAPPAPAPEPEVQQEAEPEPEKRKPLNERLADFFRDNEYSGKDEEGTGAGSEPDGKDGKDDGTSTSGTSGTGTTGDGDSDSGNRENGSGDGWVEGMGSLSRARISSPPISDLVKKVGRVVVKVCINKRGAVVYVEYDEENSTLQDIGHKQRAITHVQQIVFERNDGAPDKECGRLTFRMTRNGFTEE